MNIRIKAWKYRLHLTFHLGNCLIIVWGFISPWWENTEAFGFFLPSYKWHVCIGMRVFALICRADDVSSKVAANVWDIIIGKVLKAWLFDVMCALDYSLLGNTEGEVLDSYLAVNDLLK